MVKTVRKILIILVFIIVGILAFWYFFGLSFIPQEVHEEMPPYDTVVKGGSFIAIDSIHTGSGQAKIVQSGDKNTLILENFEVTNGPDLYVYLSSAKKVTDKSELGEFKEVARLKGNIGNQTYDLSKEDLAKYNSVVIWCKRFGVLFSSASLG